MSDRASSALRARLGRTFRSNWRVLLALSIGLVLTLAVSAVLVLQQQQARQRLFSASGEDISRRLRKQLMIAEYGLNGTRGAILTAGGLERLRPQQFQDYIRSRRIREEFPGTRGIGIVRRIPPADASGALELLRADGWPLTRIWQFAPHPGERLVVQSVEPVELNREALGLDLASEPRRREVVYAAFRTGKAALSAPLQLVQVDNRKQRGFQLVLPVYRSPVPPGTEAERLSQATGAVLMPMLLDETMGLFDWPKDRIRISLSDVTDPQRPEPFFRSQTLSPLTDLHDVETLNILGRVWRIDLRGTKAFDAGLPFAPWRAVLVAGFLLSFAGAFIVWLDERARRHIGALNVRLEEQAVVREGELARAREEALAATRHFRTIFEQNPLGIALVNRVGNRVEQANLRFAELFGDPARFVGDCQWIGPASAQSAAVQNTVEYRRPDGQPVWARLTLSPVDMLEGGPAERSILMAEDITAEHENTARLDEALKRLQLATDAAGIGIWFWTFSDDLVAWDRRMFELFGLSEDPRDRIRPSYDVWASCLHAEDRAEAEASLAEATRSGRRWNATYRIVHPDGTVRHIEALAVPSLGPDGVSTGMLGVCRDITDELRLKTDLVTARDAAQAADKAKTQFLANMSHELRTPMNAIIGLISVLAGTPLDGTQQGYVGSIRKSATALLRILNDILDHARLEAGALEIVADQFALSEVMEEVGALFSIRAAEKGVGLAIDVAEDARNQYWGDALRLAEVLNNLVDNAIKFTSEGGVTVSVRRLAGEGSRDRLRFEVRDSGIGLSPAEVARLFRPFAQADQSWTRSYGGSGLGLSICRLLVRAMDGEIGVDSTSGGGSTFWFELPLERRSGAMAGPLPALQQERVLVAGPSDDGRAHLVECLRGWNFDVATAANPAAARDNLLDAVASGRAVSLAVLDWSIVSADSGWLLDELHEAMHRGLLPRTMTLLVVSPENRAGLDGVASRLSLMPDAVLTKPVLPSRLYDVISDLQKRGETDRPGSVVPLDEITPAERTRTIRGARILVAEDNRTNQEVALAMLGQMGMRVDVAGNGEEALRMLETGDYGLVLMDLHMPVMNGLDAARAIRAGEHGNRLPIVALTAAAFPDDRRNAKAAGMDDFISKPVDPHKLASTLLRWLPATGRSAVEDAPGGLPDMLEGFDLSSARTRLGGGDTLLVRVLQAFRSDFADWEQRARAAFGQADLAALGVLAHTLRGGAGGVGAVRVEAAAAALEASVRSGGEAVEGQDLAMLLDAASGALADAERELQGVLPD